MDMPSDSMKKALTIVSALFLLDACSTAETAPRGEAAYAAIPPAPALASDYRISPDDVLRVQVYHEPGLSLEDAQVTAAGMVRMPLIGDVPVAGLSAGEASDVIAGRLGERYLVSPQVTIFVKKAVGRRITVDGEVREPGLFPIDGRLGLLQAIAMAKGPTRLASLKQIVVVRQADGMRKAAMFDLSAIRRGEAPDPEILPGDTIIVGSSRAKAILGGTLLALPAIGAGFVALEGGR
ncbi:Polysaccharide export protein [Sphingobium herbicidovorans NBRC 16415]|uniref:Polysaccharide export protein n=1 Tax=Sphingobium herbicidovorans (strain ATCC 700291 / DSM 11019 / CCUG 56400 / KCTC 2939 / LMG 18315 / NBRC 16415 / MH) TaxID=1219045 RepID=A0A086P862_SPHHM|nr:polysaccharide biosynthesis/export family protein [Sphingobium herbicidovorans]KFG89580.1 Polysaccharide export protein [Sphingobium herbicidovorans NBRC 16415]